MSEREEILLKTAMQAGIHSPRELANFMAQVSHESANLKRLDESFNYRNADRVMSVVSSTRRFGHDAVQSAVNEAHNGHPEKLAEMMYGGRMGNNEAGDGWKYHGRGFIQLTGKANYAEAAKRTGIDLVNHPELAANSEIAAKIAVDYWQHRVPHSARENVQSATRAINGGTNGLSDRIEKFEQYQRKLTPEYLERVQHTPIQSNATQPTQAAQQIDRTKDPVRATSTVMGIVDGALETGKEWVDMAEKKFDETVKDVKDAAQGAWDKVTDLFDGDDSPSQKADKTPSQTDVTPKQTESSPVSRKDAQHNGVFDKGDRGEDVKQVQAMLASLGAKIGVDGVYGPETERAVKGYQMMNGLEVDGIVGPKTMAALREDAQRIGGQTVAAPVQVEERYKGSPDKYMPPQAQQPAEPQPQVVQAAQAVPQLSATAQSLNAQAEAKVREYCSQHGQPWNQGMDNTVAALAAAAREAKMTNIEMFAVKDGNINLAQKDATGFGYITAQVNAREAANTPVEQSQERMAKADVQQSQQQDNPTQTQNKTQSGPSMG